VLQRCTVAGGYEDRVSADGPRHLPLKALPSYPLKYTGWVGHRATPSHGRNDCETCGAETVRRPDERSYRAVAGVIDCLASRGQSDVHHAQGEQGSSRIATAIFSMSPPDGRQKPAAKASRWTKYFFDRW